VEEPNGWLEDPQLAEGRAASRARPDWAMGLFVCGETRRHPGAGWQQTHALLTSVLAGVHALLVLSPSPRSHGRQTQICITDFHQFGVALVTLTIDGTMGL